jgi:hypothetical protein
MLKDQTAESYTPALKHPTFMFFTPAKYRENTGWLAIIVLYFSLINYC